jgi:hypothetical protein
MRKLQLQKRPMRKVLKHEYIRHDNGRKIFVVLGRNCTPLSEEDERNCNKAALNTNSIIYPNDLRNNTTIFMNTVDTESDGRQFELGDRQEGSLVMALQEIIQQWPIIKLTQARKDSTPRASQKVSSSAHFTMLLSSQCVRTTAG